MRRLISIVLLAFSAQASSMDFYAEFAANAVLQKVDDTRFDLASTEVRGGAYVMPQIGLELFAGAGVVDDSKYDLTQSITQSYGIATRFESPMVDGTKAFILLGYAATELNLENDQGPAPGKEFFEGFSYGVGLEQQLFNKRSDWYLNGRWQSYYSSGDIDISVFGVGVRYQF
jgi:outer membrane protein with beta-barrel domain